MRHLLPIAVFIFAIVSLAVADNSTETESRDRRQANNYWQRYREQQDMYADQQRQMYQDSQRRMYEEREAAMQDYQQRQREESERRFQEEMDYMYGRGKRDAGNEEKLVRQKRHYYGGYGSYGMPYYQAGLYGQGYGLGYGLGYYPNYGYAYGR